MNFKVLLWSFLCNLVDAYISNLYPFIVACLTRILFLPMCFEQGKAVNEKAQGPGKGLHILVAEDNIVNQRVAVTLLQKWGHSTVLACNGAEAVEKSAEGNFDLILMDVCTSSSILYSNHCTICLHFVIIDFQRCSCGKHGNPPR